MSSKANDDDSSFSSFSSNSSHGVLALLDIRTEDQILVIGLGYLNYSEHQVWKVKRETSNDRFRSAYGANPHVYAKLWEDLQSTDIPGARLDAGERNIKYFFMTLHFLTKYDTEYDSEAIFQMSDNYVRRYKWLYIEKIRALKEQVIKWPENIPADDIWVVSVDGTHFRTEEPTHPDFPKDTAAFSFKHHCAGFNYEVGLSLWESKLIWFKGPFLAGEYNDLKMFTDAGLKAKLQSTGKKGIADGGYAGYPKLLSTPNTHDLPEVAKFKSRARLRHEKYNGMCKEFDCLDSRFRHSREKLQACFEAVAVVVQYKMAMGTPLYDV